LDNKTTICCSTLLYDNDAKTKVDPRNRQAVWDLVLSDLQDFGVPSQVLQVHLVFSWPLFPYLVVLTILAFLTVMV